MIVPALGMTGGISSGVTYFGTDSGSRVPPGIWAIARSTQPNCVATYHPIVDAPVSLRKLRRERGITNLLPRAPVRFLLRLGGG